MKSPDSAIQAEVFDAPVIAAGLVRDLHSRGTRRCRHLAYEWTHPPMIRSKFDTQI